MSAPPEAQLGPEWRYLSLIRALGTATHEHCDPECDDAVHRMDAAQHVNAFIRHPKMVAALANVVEHFNERAL